MALQAVGGLFVFHILLWGISERREAIPWRIVVLALVAQFVLAYTLTTWPAALLVFDGVNRILSALTDATTAGTRFVFGYLAGGPQPFMVTDPQAVYVLALHALPLIIVMSALTRVLTYWRVLPWLIGGLSRLLERSLGLGGALGLGAAANVFIGMIESPLLIRPYVSALSRGELFTLMACGMATIAGTVFVLFATILTPVLPYAGAHLLTASLMSLPAAIAFSVMLIPPGATVTAGTTISSPDASGFDALANGTYDGLRLYFNVVAMLLVLVALVHLANHVLGAVTIDSMPLSLERLLGWVLAPLCWLLGIPAAEVGIAGQLLGTKIVLNELIAYVNLAALPDDALAPTSRLILTYALCGFANLGSMGMLVAALGMMAPERRLEIMALGPRAILVGVLATCTTGAVVGILH